jgi:hypothetical protein
MNAMSRDAPSLLNVADIVLRNRDDHRRVPHLLLHHETLLEEVVRVHRESVGNSGKMMHNPGRERLEGREVGMEI